jgi:hypothetical protein
MWDIIKTIAETFQYIALGLAVIIGGGWTLYQFFIKD